MAKRIRQTRKRRPRRPRRREGLLAKVVILLLLAVLSWRLYGLREQVAGAQAERDRRNAEAAALQEEHDALEADLDAGVTPEKVEEIARDQLGLVHRDEYVFYTGS